MALCHCFVIKDGRIVLALPGKDTSDGSAEFFVARTVDDGVDERVDEREDEKKKVDGIVEGRVPQFEGDEEEVDLDRGPGDDEDDDDDEHHFDHRSPGCEVRGARAAELLGHAAEIDSDEGLSNDHDYGRNDELDDDQVHDVCRPRYVVGNCLPTPMRLRVYCKCGNDGEKHGDVEEKDQSNRDINSPLGEDPVEIDRMNDRDISLYGDRG